WPYTSVDEFKSRPALSGIPFVGPWANRLDEQAFYANGRKYAFDMTLGNVGGEIPIHGFLSTTDRWRVVEAKADGNSACVPSRLEFFKEPAWMKQFRFEHAVDVAYRGHDGVLGVKSKGAHISYCKENGSSSRSQSIRTGAQSWYGHRAPVCKAIRTSSLSNPWRESRTR